MCIEANVRILYHAMIESVLVENGIVKSISILCCGKRLSVNAPLFVDASGDGDLLYQAGVPFAVLRSDGARGGSRLCHRKKTRLLSYRHFRARTAKNARSTGRVSWTRRVGEGKQQYGLLCCARQPVCQRTKSCIFFVKILRR